ncbi:MAG: SCO1664 family protein, partial [Dermatophilaceae bacterium]
HVICSGGRVRGCDHGVRLGVEPKLRTVVWGWAGSVIPAADRARLERLAAALDDGLAGELAPLLTRREVAALAGRVETLLRDGTHPLPQPGWPAIPWPAL